MRELQTKLSLRKLELEQCKYFQGRVQLAIAALVSDYVHTVLMWLTIAAPASDTVLMAVTGELGCVSVFAQRVVFTSWLFRMPCIVRP